MILFAISIVTSFYNLNSISKSVEIYDFANQLVRNTTEIQTYYSQYLARGMKDSVDSSQVSIRNCIDLIANMIAISPNDYIMEQSESIKKNLFSQQAIFTEIVNNTQMIKLFESKMGDAFTTISKTMTEKIRAPIETKKNDAMVFGEEISPYYQEVLSATEKTLSILNLARLEEISCFVSDDPQNITNFKTTMKTLEKSIKDWSFLIETLNDKEISEQKKKYPPSLKSIRLTCLKKYTTYGNRIIKFCKP